MVLPLHLSVRGRSCSRSVHGPSFRSCPVCLIVTFHHVYLLSLLCLLTVAVIGVMSWLKYPSCITPSIQYIAFSGYFYYLLHFKLCSTFPCKFTSQDINSIC